VCLAQSMAGVLGMEGYFGIIEGCRSLTVLLPFKYDYIRARMNACLARGHWSVPGNGGLLCNNIEVALRARARCKMHLGPFV